MRAGGREHDFLEGHGVTGVYAAVQDVEEGDGEDVKRFLGPGLETDVFVKGDILRHMLALSFSFWDFIVFLAGRRKMEYIQDSRHRL